MTLKEMAQKNRWPLKYKGNGFITYLRGMDREAQPIYCIYESGSRAVKIVRKKRGER